VNYSSADSERRAIFLCQNTGRRVDTKSVGEETAMHNREFKVQAASALRRWTSWLLCLVTMGIALTAQTPPTTTVSDTVYRADGTPASGTLLISWPAFTTANGVAIAGGTKSVALGSGGVLSVALVPNAGASPANTVYTVVYQLTDGTVKCLNASLWAKSTPNSPQ